MTCQDTRTYPGHWVCPGQTVTSGNLIFASLTVHSLSCTSFDSYFMTVLIIWFSVFFFFLTKISSNPLICDFVHYFVLVK